MPSPLPPHLHVYDDVDQLAAGAAAKLATVASAAVRERGRCSVALSGGSTPACLFRVLARGAQDGTGSVPFDAMHFFWSDERCVPSDHEESNFGNAHRLLLSTLSVAPHKVHRVRTELGDPGDIAADYRQQLEQHFASAPGEPPVFDVVFLGMGDDGHTASLFPGTRALDEDSQWVVANPVPALDVHRITFTYPLINRAAWVMVLVVGEGKAAVLREVWQGPRRPSVLPIQGVAPHPGELHWYCDRRAVALLDDGAG